MKTYGINIVAFVISFVFSRLSILPLTHCILADSSTAICWTSPIVILGMLGLFCRFYSIFDGKSC